MSSHDMRNTNLLSTYLGINSLVDTFRNTKSTFSNLVSTESLAYGCDLSYKVLMYAGVVQNVPDPGKDFGTDHSSTECSGQAETQIDRRSQRRVYRAHPRRSADLRA